MDKLTSLEKNEDNFLEYFINCISNSYSISKQDIERVVSSIIKETNKKDFFSFKRERGDYPNMFCINDELQIKADIYLGFTKEKTDYMVLPRFELLDHILDNYKKTTKDLNRDIHKEFYNFLRMFVHLGYKVLFNISNIKDINTIISIFNTNLDYLFAMSKESKTIKESAFRDVINPVKYFFNREINTVTVRKDLDKDSFMLTCLEEDAVTFHSSFSSIYNILDKYDYNTTSAIKDRDFIQQYLSVYICLLIHLSSEVLTICEDCNELYFRPPENKENCKCYDCDAFKNNKDKIVLYKR